ncbi:uncharacterized protein LOC136088218 [Hydra vulgaris]|uniref:Uncharacterized protein LOC136088218 n=1 Tax=Hydra vulgaris TaxID=6087 RepID=A0ABM4D153_HYDVU
MTSQAEYMQKYRKIIKDINSCFELESPALSDSSTNMTILSEISTESQNLSNAIFCNFVDISDNTQLVGNVKLTSSSCNGLLTLLRKHGCQLPKDSHSLLQTPSTKQIQERYGGKYIYFGLTKVLQNAINLGICSDSPNLQINVDGIPLYRSSKKQFWPILSTVNQSSPTIVALYQGDSKPSSVNEFLKDFIEEFKLIVCDAPARAFLKNIVGHNSLHACERFLAVGMSTNKRTIFVSTDCFNAEKRTDDSFKNLEFLGSH